MHIAVGCDHRGLKLKQALMRLLNNMGHSCEDFGCYDESSVDYPDIAQVVAVAVAGRQCDWGILVCSTGIGMSIAANKVKGIRAAQCHDLLTARRARQHNDANVICLGQDTIGEELAGEIVGEFMKAEFEGDRHQERLDKIAVLEGRNGRKDR